MLSERSRDEAAVTDINKSRWIFEKEDSGEVLDLL